MVLWVKTVSLFVNIITSAVRGRVGKEPSPECRVFLHMGERPMGMNHDSLKFICQHYSKKSRYVTLYNIVEHVPIYAPYTFRCSDGEKCVDVPWRYKPQLSTIADTNEMQPFPSSHTHMNSEDAQAVLEDYTDAIYYNRGTLNPDEHQNELDDKASTYTLTNVVPMVPDFNSNVRKKQEHIIHKRLWDSLHCHRSSVRPWAEHHDVIRKHLNNFSCGKAFVIPWVTTSGRMIHPTNLDGVAVPEYMWPVYRCTEFDQNAPCFVCYKFPVFGAFGLNDRVNNHMVEVPFKDLEKFLKGWMNVD